MKCPRIRKATDSQELLTAGVKSLIWNKGAKKSRRKMPDKTGQVKTPIEKTIINEE